ncbi:MAG: hypothetical protein QNK15_00140 [Cycloclasticus sp.]|nr:hypothetical protein [Cycloclasticus sp.]
MARLPRLVIPNQPLHIINRRQTTVFTFRGGLLYGLLNDLDWEVTGRIAGLMGAIKIAHAGTQNHSLTLADIKTQYTEQFAGSF